MTPQEGGTMKKPIIVSVIMVLMLLVGSSFTAAQSQDPANEEKPTFYRLTPGVYVNGWPRFTVRYPKDWVEQPLIPLQLFGAKTPGSTPGEGFSIYSWGSSIPLDKYADIVLLWFKTTTDKDVTIVSDKPSQLRDGTPARELEFKMVINGIPRNWLGVVTNKGDLLISVNVTTHKGTIGEDLRAIPYSLQYEPGKDKPVKVPPDVQELLDKHGNDVLSHDIAKVMSHYSDKYLNSGMRKGEVEREWKQGIGSITSLEGATTEFIPAGDRAYLTGFVITNFGTVPIGQTSIIKESGEWKWYGNQRDVSP
jgi:hypothetical protein